MMHPQQNAFHDACRCRRPIVVRLALALLLVGAVGCAKETAQVSGRVQYKGGKPVTGGIRVIRFEPTPDTTAIVKKAASSNIEQDGSFTLYTRSPGDGVYLGRYAVTFTILSSATGGKLLVDPVYVEADSTPHQVDISGDKSDFVFEIEPNQ